MDRSRRASSFGASLRTIRAALGVSQRELARRISRSQAFISAVENGRSRALRLADAEDVCTALGATLVLGVEAPLLFGRDRQRDFVHSRCVGHVSGRLRSAGWLVEREVEVGERRRPGWIDVLAFRPSTEMALVIEVKTAVDDLGDLERQIGWYEREAVPACRRVGWRPRHIAVAVLLLSTEANDATLRRNRVGFTAAFPGRSGELQDLVNGTSLVPRRTLAMIAPQSKARRWIRPTVLEGRRSAAAYLHYADAVRRMSPPTRDRGGAITRGDP